MHPDCYMFFQVLERVVSRLKRYGVIYHSNAERMSKGQLLHARDQFNQNGGTVSGAPVSVGLMH